MVLKCFTAIVMVALVSANARATNLFTPFSLDSAQVLPKGVRNMRVLGFTGEISGRFDGSSSIVPVGQPFNKTIRVGELQDSQPAGFERDKLAGGLKSFGLGSDAEVGRAFGVVNSRVTSTVPAFAYGLTDKLTVVAAVPVLYSNTSVRTGWVVNEDFERQLKALGSRGFANKIIAFREKLDNVIATKVAANGYKPLEDSAHTEVGDITLGAKYQLMKSTRSAAALITRLQLPTGRLPDVDRLIDVAPGNGTFDLGLGLAYDYALFDTVTITPTASVLYPFATNRATRVPLAYGETLTPDVDRDASFKAGEIYSIGLVSRYRFEDALVFGLGYNFQSKHRDSWSGGRYAGERYQYLSRDTEQQIHAAQVNVTYSTIPAFRRKQFPMPLEATLGIANVFGGTNVNHAALSTFDVAAFF